MGARRHAIRNGLRCGRPDERLSPAGAAHRGTFVVGIDPAADQGNVSHTAGLLPARATGARAGKKRKWLACGAADPDDYADGPSFAFLIEEDPGIRPTCPDPGLVAFVFPGMHEASRIHG
jgi:hypothetical protein